MYLVSKNAILYDILFNHIIYHSCISISLIAYLYGVQKLISKINPGLVEN